LLEGFELQLLAPYHQRAQFHSQADSLNDFLRKHAKNQHKNSTARVYVYANREGEIAGFFTLSAHMLELTGLPDSILKGRPRLPIPATLLGRFAIDQRYEGQGLGRTLLSYALREAQKASQIIASAFVVLDLAEDASAHAAELYRKCGFVALPANPGRMLLPMEEINRSL
jgi:GNAT superfamily N-acetyltransferase